MGREATEQNNNGSHQVPEAQGFKAARQGMVLGQIQNRGIRDRSVLKAMETVPRHLFVPAELISRAYEDEPLPIGQAQTISQPFIVALMTEALSLMGNENVLEIGAGSGYQAAVLSLLAGRVTALETEAVLVSPLRRRLEALGYTNVKIEEADGSLGWPADAPYDAILVAAAAPSPPPPLIAQLADGGRLVIPVGGTEHQELIRIEKRQGRVSQKTICACRFVPLRGAFGWRTNSLDSTHE